MKTLKWIYDEKTAECSRKLKMIDAVQIADQFLGRKMFKSTWEPKTLEQKFPDYCNSSDYQIFCSPTNIIRCFGDSQMLQGLALTIGWGNMARTSKHIYDKQLSEIDSAMIKCSELIQQKDSVEDAWKLCVGNLGWTDTMTSKTLHFLTRSLGYEVNPCVAIDTAIIMDELAPHFDDHIKLHGYIPSDVGTWRSRGRGTEASWTAYNRYMTAICCFAEMKNWTTTEVEATIFHDPIGFLGPI